MVFQYSHASENIIFFLIGKKRCYLEINPILITNKRDRFPETVWARDYRACNARIGGFRAVAPCSPISHPLHLHRTGQDRRGQKRTEEDRREQNGPQPILRTTVPHVLPSQYQQQQQQAPPPPPETTTAPMSLFAITDPLIPYPLPSSPSSFTINDTNALAALSPLRSSSRHSSPPSQCTWPLQRPRGAARYAPLLSSLSSPC